MSCYWSNNNRAEYIERCTFGSRRGLCKPAVERQARRHFPTPHLIIQDIAQLHKIYGKDEAITGNCHVKIAYATSNPDTARYLSETSGVTTIVKEADSVSGDNSSFKRNVSSSLQEISRPLLTVDECMRLKGPEKDFAGKILVPGDMLIFVAGYAAVYGKQMLFFMDSEFRRRSAINCPVTSDETIQKNKNDVNRLNATLEHKGATHFDTPTTEILVDYDQTHAIGKVSDITPEDGTDVPENSDWEEEKSDESEAVPNVNFAPKASE